MAVEVFPQPQDDHMPRKNASQATGSAPPQPTAPSKTTNRKKTSSNFGISMDKRPKTSPDLFQNSTTSRMANALPIWEASSILTQRQQLPWTQDPNGKLHYAKDIDNGQGAIHFWVTEDLEDEHPATLAGAAALAVIDTFDIRAACMHLIYAAHATQLARPWEQEIIISDQQIENYLGLKKRTDKNKREKLALIEEIAKQPCKITTFISCRSQGKVKGFTLEEGRLWHLMGTRYHYQQNLQGERELTGISFVVKPGLWAQYFLNEESRHDRTGHYQQGNLSKNLLESVMSLWQHREGAARLMVWLLFQDQFNRRSPLNVAVLMEIAYGQQKIQQAKDNSEHRKKLASTWDEDLLTLHDRGWRIQFDPETYPIEIQPLGFGRENLQRPRGFFDKLLLANLWIQPQEEIAEALPASASTAETTAMPIVISALTGEQIKELRQAQGWGQRKLATLTGISQGMICMIENGSRSITPENEAILRQIFEI
jgi:DNA-binding transcriptional regulator YiaG